MINTNMDIRIYEYVSEPGIFNHIRDFAFGTPRSNYNRVIAEIKSSFNKNICGVYCRFRTRIFFGQLMRMPQLIRQTHATCQVCNRNALSDYDHTACFECASEEEYPIEFHYFHRHC